MNKKIWGVLSLCALCEMCAMAQQATSLDQLVFQQVQNVCPTADQMQAKTADELNQLSAMLQNAAAFFDGAPQKNSITTLKKSCDLQLTSKDVLSNTNGDTITDFTMRIISNADYNDPAFGSIFQTVYQICSIKLLNDLVKLTTLTPITISSLTTIQDPGLLSSILQMLTQTKNKNFMNFSGNISIGNQSFNPGDENSPNSAKNAISNLIVSTSILTALVPADNAAKLAALKTLADSLPSLVSSNSISDVTRYIFATATMSAAKAANLVSNDTNLSALLNSAKTNKLISDATVVTSKLTQPATGGTTTGTTTAGRGATTTGRGGTAATGRGATTTGRGGTTTATTTGTTAGTTTTGRGATTTGRGGTTTAAAGRGGTTTTATTGTTAVRGGRGR